MNGGLCNWVNIFNIRVLCAVLALLSRWVLFNYANETKLSRIIMSKRRAFYLYQTGQYRLLHPHPSGLRWNS